MNGCPLSRYFPVMFTQRGMWQTENTPRKKQVVTAYCQPRRYTSHKKHGLSMTFVTIPRIWVRLIDVAPLCGVVSHSSCQPGTVSAITGRPFPPLSSSRRPPIIPGDEYANSQSRHPGRSTRRNYPGSNPRASFPHCHPPQQHNKIATNGWCFLLYSLLMGRRCRHNRRAALMLMSGRFREMPAWARYDYLIIASNTPLILCSARLPLLIASGISAAW